MSFTFDPYKLRSSDAFVADDVLLTNPTALAELEEYWKSLPRTRGVPMRKDVNPVDMEGVLEDSFILERVAPGVARIRVAGRSVSGLLGIEPRGLPLSAAFLPVARPDLAHHLESAFMTPGLVEMELTSPRAIGQPMLHGRILLLPLRDDRGRINRLLGVMVMSGRRGLGGRRFELSDSANVRFEPALGLHTVDGGKSPKRRPSPRVEADKNKAEDMPALRLVVSNA